MSKPRQYMVICLNNEGYECLNNEGYEVSLEKRKIYFALTDEDAGKHGLIRIIDESGEDYLYSSKLFTQVELPPRIQRAILKAA